MIATLLGIIGFLGTGHFYVGRVRRGIILLIGVWVIIGACCVFMLLYGMSGMVVPPPGYPEQEPPEYRIVFVLVSLVLCVGYGVLWIWQIIDARAACRRHNKQIS